MTIEDLNRLSNILSYVGDSLNELLKLHKHLSDTLQDISEELGNEISNGIDKPISTGKVPSMTECVKCKYFIPPFEASADLTLGTNRCYLKTKVVNASEQKNCKDYRPFKNTKELYTIDRIKSTLNIKDTVLQDAINLLGIRRPEDIGENEWGVVKKNTLGILVFYFNEFAVNCIRNITRWGESSIVYNNTKRIDKFQFYRKEAVLTEPAKKEPAKKEPAKKEPAKKEPAKKEPANKEPAKKEPAKKEPAKKEPVKKEPAKKEPAKKEPAKKEPAKKEPAKKEPAKTNTQNKRGRTKKE